VSSVRAEAVRGEIDGIPVHWAEAPPPFTAALLFRVGRADETLPTAGLTHLIEHLALFAVGRTDFYSNGLVDSTHTVFWANGTAEETLGFLQAVAHALANLPLERLEAEKRVLQTEEEAGPRPSVHARLLNLRFGARDYGLGTLREFALRRASVEEVAAWARERFNRANAAIWMTGPPPAELALELPAGRRHLPPEPRPLGQLELPAEMAEGTGGVAIASIGLRSTGLATGLGIAGQRVHDRLRREQGLSYAVGGTYEPLTKDVVHFTLGADCLDAHAVTIRDGILAVARDLAEHGPTEQELDEVRADRVKKAFDPIESRGYLDYAVRDELLGADVLSERELITEQESVTRDDVAAALTPTLEQIIALVPERTPRGKGFSVYGTWPVERLEGRVYRERWLPFGKQVRVIGAQEGISLVSPGEPEPVTIRFDECVGVLRWSPTRMTVLGLDGSWVELRAWSLRDGDKLLEHIGASVSPERFVSMEDVQDLTSLIELARDKLGRTDCVEQFNALPENLIPGERVENLAQASTSLFEEGIVALTDRRVVYISKGSLGRMKSVRSFDRDDVTLVHGNHASLVWLRRRVGFVANGETVRFKAIQPRRRAVEFWRALREQAERTDS
jgi:zinc protease